MTDKKVQNLIDWVCLSGQIKENNNLYEKQNDLKGQKYKIKKLLER